MAFVQYKIYAYCYNNGSSTYSWVELVDGNGRSRLVSFDDISVSASSPLKNFASYADLNSIVVSDHDNFWGNIPDASDGLINSSDPKWKDWYHRPIKLAICDENGAAVKSIVVLLDDIAIKEEEVKATLSVIGLARAAMEAKADGKTIGGNTIYGDWTGDTTPTLFAAYTEDLDFNFTERTWFRNRRIKDILKKQVYALNHDVFGAPSIADINIEYSDGRMGCSTRSDLSNGTAEIPYAMVASEVSGLVYIAAGNKLYKYTPSTDTYVLLYTDSSGTAIYHKMWLNENVGDAGRLYIVRADGDYGVLGGTQHYLKEYDIDTDTIIAEEELKDIASEPGVGQWRQLQIHYIPSCSYSANGAIFWISESAGFYTYNLYRCDDMDVNWGSLNIRGLPTDCVNSFGICSTLDNDGVYLGLSHLAAPTQLYVLDDFATGEWRVLTTPGYALFEIMPIDTGGDVLIFCSGYTFTQAKICWTTDDGRDLAEDMTDLDASSGVQCPRRMGFINMSDASDVCIYYIRSRENQFASIRCSLAGGTFAPYIQEENLSSGDEVYGLPMFNDGNNGINAGVYAGVVWDLEIYYCLPTLLGDTIYGIAFPNYTLFQIAPRHSGFLPLLKWDGMSCADICDALAQHQNAIWYYDDDGVFHFEQATDTGLSSVKDFAEGEAISLEAAESGRAEIVNRYKYVPYNIKQSSPDTGEAEYDQQPSSDIAWNPPKVLLSCDEVAHWRVTITNSGTGAYSLQKFVEDGTWAWKEQTTGTLGTILAHSYLVLPADVIAGTYANGDTVYFYVLPTVWDFEKMNIFSGISVQDATSISTYQRQDKDIDGKFIPRLFAGEILANWLAISKNPHRKLTARLPFEGNESVLKTGNIITITCAKLGLTSSNKLKITSLAWSGDNCRIAVAAELLQMT